MINDCVPANGKYEERKKKSSSYYLFDGCYWNRKQIFRCIDTAWARAYTFKTRRSKPIEESEKTKLNTDDHRI